MDFHILNGDALTDRFLFTGLPGTMIITREAMISGSLEGEDPDSFFKTRAKYLAGPGQDETGFYFAYSVSEFNKISDSKEGDRFFLWFGYDLFCLMNMLFMISLIRAQNISTGIEIVYPSFRDPVYRWDDFGKARREDLLFSFQNRIVCSDEDLRLAADLWDAFRRNDLDEIRKLSKKASKSFPYLEEVCQAHIDRFSADGLSGRPERRIREIIQGGVTSFNEVFRDFYTTEGVYGFGDTQVREIYERILINR